MLDGRSRSPVPGAAFWLAPGYDTGYARASLEPITETDAQGSAVIAAHQVAVPADVVVTADGYLPTHLELAEHSGSYDVFLEPAAKLIITVRDELGQWVSDVPVIAYGGAADARSVMGLAPRRYEVSLFPSESLCAEGTTDVNGNATLWVPPGKYSCTVTGDSYFMLDAPPLAHAESHVDEVVEITVGQLYGCLLALPPGHSDALGLSRRLASAGWVVRNNLFGSLAAARAEKALRLRYPQHVALVVPCHRRSGTLPDTNPALAVRVLVEGRGWSTQKCELMPVAHVVPQQLAANGAAAPLGVITIEYGGTIPEDQFWEFMSLKYQNDRSMTELRLPLRRAVRLPEGVLEFEDYLGSRVLREIHVREGREEVVAFDDATLGSATILSVEIGQNAAPWGCSIVGHGSRPGEQQSRAAFEVSPLNPEAVPVLVPPGRYDVTVTWQGKRYTRASVPFDVGFRRVKLRWDD